MLTRLVCSCCLRYQTLKDSIQYYVEDRLSEKSSRPQSVNETPSVDGVTLFGSKWVYLFLIPEFDCRSELEVCVLIRPEVYEGRRSEVREIISGV